MLLALVHAHLAAPPPPWRIPSWLLTPDWYRPLSRFVLHFVREHQALGLFGVIFAEELGIPLPVPGDVAVAWGGYLSSIGAMPEWMAVASVVAAATLGSTCLYLASRRFGHPFVMRFGRYVGLNQDRFLRAEASFKRWGPWAVILGRHIPGMRIYLSALAGLFEMRAVVFIPSVIVSSTAWALIFITVGRMLGRQAGRLSRLFPAHLVPYAVLLILVIAFLVVAHEHGWHPFRRPRGEEPEEAGDAASSTHAELHKT